MILNEKLPKYLLGKYQQIGTVTFSVLFAVVFLNIYIPFSDTAWFGLGDSIMFLHTVIFIIYFIAKETVFFINTVRFKIIITA